MHLIQPSFLRAHDFDCIRVMGYSTVRSWYGGETKSKFEKYIEDESTWELLFKGASIITRWADPTWEGWKGEVKSPCRKKSGNPEVVLLSVASNHANVEQMKKEIRATMDLIHSKWKNVRYIILQPQIGGPDNKPCAYGKGTVRDSRLHPLIDEAVKAVSDATENVFMGMSPEVRTCNDWSDGTGHLKSSAQDPIGKMIAEYYNEFFKEFPPSNDPVSIVPAAAFPRAVSGYLQFDASHAWFLPTGRLLRGSRPYQGIILTRSTPGILRRYPLENNR